MKSKTFTKKFVVGLVVVALLASAMVATVQAFPSTSAISSGRQVNSVVGSEVAVPAEVEDLISRLPTTFAEVEANIIPFRGRFLMWTHDLQHVMWGKLGRQFFVGTDNEGKQAWGIYGRGYFAGFYDGDFFWGRYRGGSWKAQGLFGLDTAYGRYAVFPFPFPTTTAVAP